MYIICYEVVFTNKVLFGFIIRSEVATCSFSLTYRTDVYPSSFFDVIFWKFKWTNPNFDSFPNTFCVKRSRTFWYATITTKTIRIVFFWTFFTWTFAAAIGAVAPYFSRYRNYDRLSCLAFVKDSRCFI